MTTDADRYDPMQCPKCGGECYRDEVDIGVGIMYGPWGCLECGWSSSPEYDRSEGMKYDEEGYLLNQFGHLYPTIRREDHGK